MSGIYFMRLKKGQAGGSHFVAQAIVATAIRSAEAREGTNRKLIP